MENEIKVLDHGFIRLDDSMADDLSVVNSARVSFAKRSEYEPRMESETWGFDYDWPPPKLKTEDAGLIRYLMKHRHGTPFEHNAFRFHVKLPIFVAREWQRHRIGSYNEWSARYSELEPDFYIPEPDQVRAQVGKPGAYTYEPVIEAVGLTFGRSLIQSYRAAYGAYQTALENGIAKEQARLFLPVAIYTQMYWTVNARSLMNFLSLRNSDQAQYEIRQYAQVIETIFEKEMPVTYEAFVENNRVAP